MTVVSALAAKVWSLSPARNAARKTVGVKVPMRDGVHLLADLYQPALAGQPTVLIRSPYGRGAVFGLAARLFAERGYQVVVQSCRGTSDSQGALDPFFQEKADGLDTVDWIEAQPWFAGKLASFGPSYLGNVQWAIASELGERLSAMSVAVSLSDFSEEIRHGGGLTLEGSLGWTHQLATMSQLQGMAGLFRRLGGKGKIPPSKFDHLPLGALDQLATGKTVAHWQDWLEHGAKSQFWQPIDHGAVTASVTCPVTMIAGWFDIFLPSQLRDFAALRANQNDARIMIGPWTHIGAIGNKWPIIDALEWFDHHLKGLPLPERPRVRYWSDGKKAWQAEDEWPPASANMPTSFYIAEEGRLTKDPAAEDGWDSFEYDPANPTPSIGGAKLSGGGRHSKMGELMKRDDVLSYISEPLEMAGDLTGPVAVEICTQANTPDHDLFVCLCEVGKDGVPRHLSDGYLRLGKESPSADGNNCRSVRIDCWPIASRIAEGNRLCLMIAAGAHPRYARNLGTGEPLRSATQMQPVQIKVRHAETKITLPPLIEVAL